MPAIPAKEERDLSFKPVLNDAPRKLTRQQLDFYNQYGYVMPLAAFAPAEAEKNRNYFDNMLREVQHVRSDLDSYSINGFHTCCAGLYDIVKNPVILDHVQDIVGPEIVCWGSHFFCKLAGEPRKVAWHQDASYWPLSPARTVTVWLAIDDADRQNAAMMFLPGTHKAGHLKWRELGKDKAVLNQEIVDAEQFGQPVYDELKAGQFSLHADMLAHGSEANLSSRRRCGLTIRYCPPIVRPLNPSWGTNAILCRGSSASEWWTYHPRPDGENVRARVQTIGAN